MSSVICAAACVIDDETAVSDVSMRVTAPLICASDELTMVDWLIWVRLTAPIESPSEVTAAELLAVIVVNDVLTLASEELMPVTDEPRPTRLELTLPRLMFVPESALLTCPRLELVLLSELDNPAVDVLTLPRLVLTPLSEVLTLPKLALTPPRLVLSAVWLELMLITLFDMLITDVLTLMTVLLMIVTDVLTFARLVPKAT